MIYMPNRKKTKYNAVKKPKKHNTSDKIVMKNTDLNKQKLKYKLKKTKIVKASSNNDAVIDKNKVKPEVIVLKEEAFDITNIIHISDVHIPCSEGFDDFERLFDNLFDEIKKESKKGEHTIFCILGDVLHEGCFTGDPRSRNTLEYLYNGLLLQGDCISISGNHEQRNSGKYNNDNPLEHMIGKRFSEGKKNTSYILNKNANYIYNNLVFCPTQFNATSVTECVVKNKFPIGMYHGQLYKSRNNAGFKFMDDTLFRVTDFTKRYKITLLGDIHAYSYMDAARTVCYAGSTKQLNSGESIRKGVVKWYLKTLKSKLIEIKDTSKKYFNIASEKEARSFVKNLHKYDDVRLIDIVLGSESNTKKIQRILESGKAFDGSKHVMRLQKKKKKIINDLDLSLSIGGDDILLDIKNKKGVIDVAMNYARENIKYNKKKLDDVTLEKIRKSVESKTKNIEYKVDTKIKNIKIKELRFDNILIYGKGNKIMFENLEGLVGLVAENGNGKSACLDALMIAIYGECPRGSYKKIAKNGSCGKGSKCGEFNTYVRFSVNDKIYVIERTYREKKKGHHCLDGALLKFYEKVDDEEKHIFSGSEKKDWNAHFHDHIKIHLCSYDDFKLNFTLFQNSESSSFVNMNAIDRRKVLLKVFKVDIFTEIGDEIVIWKKEIVKRKGENTTRLKDQEVKIGTNSVKFKDKEIKINESFYNMEEQSTEDSKNLKELQKKIKTKRKDFAIHERKKVIYKDYINKHGKLHDIVKLKKDKKKLHLKLAELTKNVSDKDKEIKNKNKREKNISKNLSKGKKKYKKEIESVNTYEDQLEELNSKNEELIESMETEDYVDHDKSFYEKIIKNSKTSKFRKKFINLINKYDKGKLKMEKLIDDIMSVSVELSDDKKEINTAENNMIKINNNEKIQKKNTNKTQKINKLNDEIKELKNKIQKSNDLTDEYEENEKELKIVINERERLQLENRADESDIKKMESDIEKLENRIDDLNKIKEYDVNDKNMIDPQKELDELECENINLQNRMVLMTQRKEKIKKYYEDLKEINEQDIICELVTEIFSDNSGVTGYLIQKKIIPFIEKTTNIVLRESGFNYSIRMTCDKTKLNFKVNKTKDERFEVDAIDNSGFEKDMLNIVIMFVLSEINTKLKSNFIIIDEPFTRADPKNMQNMKNMMVYWKSIFKYILIISHNAEIQEEYDRNLEIQVVDDHTSKITAL